MKIYNEIVIDMSTLDTLYEDSYEYYGAIAECKGGGSSTSTSVDKEYNARMAAIAEKQQVIADKYFQFWETSFKPFEQAQVDANMELLPEQTTLQKTQLAFEQGLVEANTELMPKYIEQTEAGLDLSLAQTGAATDAFGKLVDMAEVDPTEAAAAASADVASAFNTAKGTTTRDLQRLGYTAGSGAVRTALSDITAEKAKATAVASTRAKKTAGEDTFNRLSQIAKAPLASAAAGGLAGGSNA